MADEGKNTRNGGSDGRGGNRRRRYFKRRSDKPEGGASQSGDGGGAQPSAQQGNAAGAQQGGQRPRGNGQQSHGKGQNPSGKTPQPASLASDPSMESGRARGVRKRRRSRARRSDLRSDTPLTTERDVAYVPPRDVFVYTHVARPSSRENYEFRSEHFSKHGHTLEDYTVDLSVIFDVPRPDFGAAVHAAFDEMEQRGDVATEARFQNWIEYADPEAYAAAQAAAAANAAANAAFTAPLPPFEAPQLAPQEIQPEFPPAEEPHMPADDQESP